MLLPALAWQFDAPRGIIGDSSVSLRIVQYSGKHAMGAKDDAGASGFGEHNLVAPLVLDGLTLADSGDPLLHRLAGDGGYRGVAPFRFHPLLPRSFEVPVMAGLGA